MLEANRFWFYSLICAVLLTLHSLFTLLKPAREAPAEFPDAALKKTTVPTPESSSIEHISKESDSSSSEKPSPLGLEQSSLFPGESNHQSSFSKRAEAGLQKRRTEEYAQKRTQLMKDLVMYGADLFIPGEATGWIKAEGWVVGSAMAVSTLLGSEEIWGRLNDV